MTISYKIYYFHNKDSFLKSTKVYFFSKRHQLKSGFRWKNYKCKCIFFIITSRDQSFTSKRGQFRFDIDNKWMVRNWNSAACWEFMLYVWRNSGLDIGCARSASTEHILDDWQVCFFVSHPLKWVNLFLSEWQCSWQLRMSHIFIYMGSWCMDFSFFINVKIWGLYSSFYHVACPH